MKCKYFSIASLMLLLSNCDDNRLNVPILNLENKSGCTISKIAVGGTNEEVYMSELVIESQRADFIKLPSKSYLGIRYTCFCEGKNKEYLQEFTPMEFKQLKEYRLNLNCSNEFIKEVPEIK
jgi:hypothetical protein